MENLYGIFLTPMFTEHCALTIAGLGLIFLFVAFFDLPLIVWTALLAATLVGFQAPVVVMGLFLFLAIIANIRPLRRAIVSSVIIKFMKSFIPKISETERTALEAGVVWAEADLFSGKPNFKKMMNEPYPELTQEEKDYLAGPVKDLCALIDDWEIWKSHEIPPPVMKKMADIGIFGIIIPKKYGGLGLSPLANSHIIQMVASRSVTAAITVMVPNSLGPAELLIHYGTDEQKKRYLNGLATGKEMPCFGLTEPQAGSDAGAIVASGVLYKADSGRLMIRLNWNKRWITLGSISTVLGLAFKLEDPDNILGQGEHVGITCALVASSLKGVDISRRHDPLGAPFINTNTTGKDVIIDAEDCVIGGLTNAGKGWKLLMESLSAGRGISLPGQSLGLVKMFNRAVSNHAVIRKQFGVSIGQFEGVEEPIARMAGIGYYLEAMVKYTLCALNQGISPPVITAIAKYNATELGRVAATDAMDVVGGAAISFGPRNLIGIPNACLPLAITVEGANILTRTLIIFGQGALRAHPYAFKEVDAVEKNDLVAFDQAFWGHVGHVVRNLARSILLSVTRGRFGGSGYGGAAGPYFRKLAWASASFAIMSDLAMGVLGGKLKVKEKLTGRYADILSWMFIATATLRRFEAEGQRKEDHPFFHYSMKICFGKIQDAFVGIFDNFEVPLVGWLFRGPLKLWARANSFCSPPSDALSHEVAKLIQTDSEQRDRLTDNIFIPSDPNQALGRLEKAYKAITESDFVVRKIKAAVKDKKLPRKKVPALIDMAADQGIITAEEKAVVSLAEELRWDAIQVDTFTDEEIKQNFVAKGSGATGTAVPEDGGTATTH